MDEIGGAIFIGYRVKCNTESKSDLCLAII